MCPIPFLMSKHNGDTRTATREGKTTRPPPLSDKRIQRIQVCAIPGLIIFADSQFLVPCDQSLTALDAMEISLFSCIFLKSDEFIQ